MATVRKLIHRLFWLMLAAWAINYFFIESAAGATILGPALSATALISLIISLIWKTPKDNPHDISDKKLKSLEAEQPNLQRWSASFDDREITVTNWYSLKSMVGACTLYIDGEMVDQSKAIVAKSLEPLLDSGKQSDSELHVQVFFAGLFKIKVAIVVNGAFVLKEELSFFDRFTRRNFPSLPDAHKR
jgi:hypothetical protein